VTKALGAAMALSQLAQTYGDMAYAASILALIFGLSQYLPSMYRACLCQ
jgi:hypothetical protein